MPEADKTNENTSCVENSSKIIQFFSTPVKEQKKEKIRPLAKVVIRRLPPRLTKEAFLNEFTLPPHDFFYFVRGDLNLGNLAFSRAYVNILNPEDIFAFKEKYDDHPMQDEQGREFHAVVEWTPQQRIPKKSTQKKSSKTATIEADPKYIEFLEKLEHEKNNPVNNTSEYFMETDSVTTKEVKVTTTPLLEYIKLKRQQKIDIRNENRIRKREAEKEKRRKEDDMRRSEKQRKEKEKAKVEVKVEANSEETNESVKSPVKEEKKKVESRPSRSANTERTEPRIRDEKFDKKPKITRKSESEFSGRHKVDDSGPQRHQSSRKVVEKEDAKVVAAPSPDGKIRAFAVPKKEVIRSTETKSKFRYSEQRNRDRIQKNSVEAKVAEPATSAEEDIKEKVKDGQFSRQSTQETSDGSLDGDELRSEGGRGDRRKQDPRVERKIRNKDRPSMEIYRPGMGRFSKQRMDVKKDEPDVCDAKKVDEVPPKPERTKDDDIKPFRNNKVLDNSDLIMGKKTFVKKSDESIKPYASDKDGIAVVDVSNDKSNVPTSAANINECKIRTDNIETSDSAISKVPDALLDASEVSTVVSSIIEKDILAVMELGKIQESLYPVKADDSEDKFVQPESLSGH